MVTITYVNTVSGQLESLIIPRDLYVETLRAMLEIGITIQNVKA